MTTPECSIVLLYYKEPERTEQAIRSILEHTAAVAYELIVVCNRTDPDIIGLVERYGIAKFGALSTNLGFSRGCNVGFQMAEGEFCCIFNDDLEVRSHDWLRHMLDPFADPEIGVTGVQINRISYIKGQCSSRRAEHLGYKPEQLRKVGYPFYAVGCLAAFRTRDLHLVGGFDPVFTPCSWEDVDLCYRLDHMLGRKISLVEGIEWRHPFRVSAGVGAVEYLNRSETVAAIAARNQAVGYDRWFNRTNE